MKEEGDHREGPDEEAPLRAGTEKRYGDLAGGSVVCQGQVLVRRSHEDKRGEWGRSGLGTGFELAD